MVVLLSIFLELIFLFIVAYFALYVLLELRALLIADKVERRKLTPIEHSPVTFDDNSWPEVTVLLPICNESGVVERLVDAVCCLGYPSKNLEILVLDDSSDETSELARVKVNEYASKGINIKLIRRKSRSGFKAGNLVNGIRQASGQFYAIFDADFVPPIDFLLQTIPHFKNPKLGYLQTGIGYENKDVSFLTRFQAMEMGSKQYITVGLSEDDNMASLSGTSCVWRKVCVEELGGWNASTVTEDVDLGYRAQFGNWQYAYLRDVVSMSLLPESISAYRVQRERWGRGLIHSAFKHVRQMLGQPMVPIKRLHAISMMFSSVLLAAIYVVILLSLPLNFVISFDEVFIQLAALFFFMLATIWGLYSAYGAYKGAKVDERDNIIRTLWNTYLYVALFLPMSLYYFVGGVRALLGGVGDFHRTPKGKDERSSTLPPINSVLRAGEIFTFIYSFFSILVAINTGNYILIPLNITVCVGFAMVLFWDWNKRRADDNG